MSIAMLNTGAIISIYGVFGIIYIEYKFYDDIL